LGVVPGAFPGLAVAAGAFLLVKGRTGGPVGVGDTARGEGE
jgi:hypothetical protein